VRAYLPSRSRKSQPLTEIYPEHNSPILRIHPFVAHQLATARQNLPVAFQLLPGFMAAAIFYTLTAHPKTSEFERIVQALIFTVFLKILVTPVPWVLRRIGSRWLSFGPWTADAELAWMTVFALPLGLLFVWISNGDVCHRFARKFGLTSRTSYPTEWYAAFAREQRWVILHLSEGRRLYGWPEEWPDQPDKGHFVIDQPEWVMEDGKRIPILQARKYIISCSEVKSVELLEDVGEITATEEELATIQRPLIDLHRSKDDGSKGTATSSEPTE
jgi:hypothetical protein